MTEDCSTVALALASISSLGELNGFVAALRDPNLPTKHVTPEQWSQIAHMKVAFEKDQRP